MVIRMMKPNCYMASIDIKDAYYSVQLLNLTKNILGLGLQSNLNYPDSLGPDEIVQIIKGLDN